jgi:hypothetical protein
MKILVTDDDAMSADFTHSICPPSHATVEIAS